MCNQADQLAARVLLMRLMDMLMSLVDSFGLKLNNFDGWQIDCCAVEKNHSPVP